MFQLGLGSKKHLIEIRIYINSYFSINKQLFPMTDTSKERNELGD